MYRKIPSSFINNLLSKIDILEIISKEIKLKKIGKNFYASCPFHDEKTPSFIVNHQQQYYYCFGCGISGNIIDFMMSFNKLNFVETIQELSCYCGLKIPFQKEIFKLDDKNQKKKIYFKVMEKIKKNYQKSLYSEIGYNARYFLKKRGLNKKIIDYYSIGFAPNQIDYFKKDFSKNELQIIQELGIVTYQKNSIYYLFYNRIIFPIHNEKGNVIGFGGRTINQTNPKYINSKETKLFHKNQNLYGLYELTKKNKKIDQILLVEGYMDVITLVQFGIKNVVALLGTAINAYHIKLLFKITRTIIFCYDGDSAGQKTAWKSLNIILPFLKDKYIVKFIFLPKNEDPDSIIRNEGKKKFENRINNAIPLSSFLIKKLLKNTYIGDIEGKAKFTSLIIPLIQKIPGKNLRLFLIKKISYLVNMIDISTILNLVNNKNIKKINYNTVNIKPTTMRILINLLIKNPKFVNLIFDYDQKIEKYNYPGLKLFLELIKICKKYPQINTHQILEIYRNTKYKRQLEKLLIWNIPIDNKKNKKIFQDALKHLYYILLNKKIELLIYKEKTTGLNKEEKNQVCLLTLEKKNIKTKKNN
ncbi:MAG: DNA primase [Arsenophonus sp.]|nr:MAG: DNA primase [Arsenophonus sp.]